MTFRWIFLKGLFKSAIRLSEYRSKRIIALLFLNVENHVCIDFQLNIISTHIIPESDKNWVFGFLTFRNIFCVFLNVKNHICIDFQLNLISTHIIPEADKNRVFGFLTFTIIFCVFENLEITRLVFWRNSFSWPSMTSSGWFIPNSDNLIADLNNPLKKNSSECHL